MTQGAGRGPVVRTDTVRDFRVPAYVHQVGQNGEDPRGSGEDSGRPGEDPRGPGEDPRALGDDPRGLSGDPHSFGEDPRTLGEAPHHPGEDPRGFGEAAGPGRIGEAAAPSPIGGPAGRFGDAPGAFGAAPGPFGDAPGHYGEANGHPGDGNSRLGEGSGHFGEETGHGTDGGRFGQEDEPEGYTPTHRDLPVINRGDTVQVPMPSPAAPTERSGSDEPGPLYVVGDVHGYLDELLLALREQGLVDAEGDWCAGHARLWFLGDFTDRGPDGIGVIDLVMRLSAQAAAVGGYCKALMGNHELLLLGAKRYGDTPVNSGAGTATFQAAWLLNGGQKSDMDRLQEHHLQWMSRLDALALEDDHLLMHSDTTVYLDYGDSITSVNDTIREALTHHDADECWDLFRKFTKRFAFRDKGGPDAVRELLTAFGGSKAVHGHSPIPYLLGEVGSEDGEDGNGPQVEGPHVYADGLAVAMDGGVTMAGKLLVRRLPLDI